MRMLSPISREWSWRTPSLMTTTFDDFDQLVESFLRPATATSINFQPACDVSETKDHYLVSFDMPGVRKDEIKIEVQGKQLVISGERQREVRESADEATLRHERVYGKFERTFVLPDSINTEKIEAQYENGVLNVAIPKMEVAKGRTIEIQSGQNGFLSKLLNTKKENEKLS